MRRVAVVQIAAEMSHPVNTRSSSLASGRKSRISGLLASVRLPRRMAPICVSDPIGLASPSRPASTPAMRVVQTAPIPTVMIPSFPLAGLMLAASGAAAPGVDMLCFTPLSCKIGALLPVKPERSVYPSAPTACPSSRLNRLRKNSRFAFRKEHGASELIKNSRFAFRKEHGASS